MIPEKVLSEALEIAMSTGADFVELYGERTRNNQIRLMDGKIDLINDGTVAGVGIRAFLGTKTVFSSTSDLSREGILQCAAAVAQAAGDASVPCSIHLTERVFPNIHPVKMVGTSAETKQKIDLLKEGCETAKNYDEKIVQVVGQLACVDHNILVANTEGLLTTNRSIRSRMFINAIASDGNENQSGYDAPGSGSGLEFFEKVTPCSIGLKAAKQAMTNLGAVYCPAGKMMVAIENGFGGVIFHEACGHSLEATAVATGRSEMAGKLGQRIACEKVTAIDDGTIPNGWGSVNVDDEGHPSQRNVLIEKGILKSYMIDRLGSRRMGLPMTGNSRRQNYTFEPTSRMTNTFIDNGPDKNEDIIASMEYGLYAKSMGGGSVDPITGEFNFSVNEGYIVRNGKICEAVRGACLIGTGSEILRNIDMVGQNLATAQGMCGSSSGSVPTDVGQPLIRVSSITVGGRNE